MLAAAVFLLYHLRHFFGGFNATALKPKLDYCVKPVAEKFYMIFNVAFQMFLFGAGGVVIRNQMLIVVTKLEIGLIKKLIFLYMAEHLKRAASFVEIIIIGEEVGKFLFKNLAGFIGKIKNINKICIKRASVKLRQLNNIRNSYGVQLVGLQKLDKGAGDLRLRFLFAFVVFGVQKLVPL